MMEDMTNPETETMTAQQTEAETAGTTVRQASLRVTLVAATEFRLPEPKGDEPWAVWRPDTLNNAALTAEFAGRMCYQSWDNPAGRSNEEYLRNILAQGHESVLEHAGFTVAVEGVSRALTHEFVRHRHLSPSQLSQRYFRHDLAAFVVPPLFRNDPEAIARLAEFHRQACELYGWLMERGKRLVPGGGTLAKKRVREAARAVLPNMTETMIVMSGNHRAWRHFFQMRGTLAADAEMRELAVAIFLEVAQPLAPAIYQDFEPVMVEDVTGEPVTILVKRNLTQERDMSRAVRTEAVRSV